MKNTRFFATNVLIGMLVILVVGLGLNYWFRPWWKQWEAQQSAAQVIQPRQTDAEADQLKNALTVSLSDRRKLAQLLWVGVTAVAAPTSASPGAIVATGSATVTELTLDTDTQNWLATEQPGFIQIMGKQSSVTAPVTSVTRDQYQEFQKQLAKLTADWTWQPLLSVWPAASGATVLKGDGVVTLPSMAELCEGQEKVEPKVANAAAQLSRLKTAVIIGPFVDLGTSGYQGSRMCDDLQKTTEAAARFIENLGAETILPIVGHFPGLGNATADPKAAPLTVATTVSDLKPFQQLFRKYLNVGVLVSPVRVTEKFDGLPCTQSADCLASFNTDYPGVLVVADGVDSRGALGGRRATASGSSAGATGSAQQQAGITIAESMKLSLLAGSDVLILEKPNNWLALTQALDILEQEMRQNPQLKQAVGQAWQKVTALRTVPTQ